MSMLKTLTKSMSGRLSTHSVCRLDMKFEHLLSRVGMYHGTEPLCQEKQSRQVIFQADFVDAIRFHIFWGIVRD